MMPQIVDLHVQIVRFVLDHQPAIVACEVVDADGQCHAFIGKVRMFLDRDLSADSAYPLPGAIRCAVSNRWRDASGRELVRVNTADPDFIESTEGLSELVVLPHQISAPADELG